MCVKVEGSLRESIGIKIKDTNIGQKSLSFRKIIRCHTHDGTVQEKRLYDFAICLRHSVRRRIDRTGSMRKLYVHTAEASRLRGTGCVETPDPFGLLAILASD